MSKEPVGSVAEEAAKLFAVLQQATAEAKSQHAAPADVEEPAAYDERAEQADAEYGVQADEAEPEHEDVTADRGGPECQWCPVCQLIAKVRTTSPETIEQLSTAAAGVLGSLRSLLEAAAEAARQARADAESRTAGQHDPEDRPARSRVDRIDVSEDPEPWD
ncbi:hypothetical protein F1D05_34565 [Kribbella qitaiheensis]|uniref:Uncharacterized protein n=1 Tax=Kribbella qitaiheensis TaxID=1544730 RepID=A0A7G6X788_9ACTN|nr:hypothetical protein [Kribbella qitaiheensis]QNE22103.1 hypothetical protein F1D05_34565 [Kribbella qitaiheensis]